MALSKETTGQLEKADEVLLDTYYHNPNNPPGLQAIEILRHRHAERNVEAINKFTATLEANTEASDRLGNKVYGLNVVLVLATVAIAGMEFVQYMWPNVPK